MQILSLSGYGINVHVDGGKLVVKDGNTYEKDPQQHRFRRKMLNFDKMVIHGTTGNITIPAIRWLMKQKRDIAILDWNGRLVTAMSPVLANQGVIKLAQYEARKDPKKQTTIAKWLIKQKIEGSIRVFDWLKTHYKDFSYNPTIYKYLQDLEKAESVNAVIRIESIVSKLYWNKLASVFDKKWEFFLRNYWINKGTRDADDPINALFNYGFSVLESEIWKVVNTVGLEPYLGFIHKTNSDKAPLIYDLQEPFRWLVELSILKILYKKKVTKSDFMATDEGNVRLKPKAVGIVLDEIARQFSGKILYNGMKREWQTMITIKARELVKLF